MYANLFMSAAVVTGCLSSAQSLSQQRQLELKTKEWVQAAPGAAKCSLIITSGATESAQLSFFLPHQGLTFASHTFNVHKSYTNTQATLARLHTSTHACSLSTYACLHALLRLCNGHKH